MAMAASLLLHTAPRPFAEISFSSVHGGGVHTMLQAPCLRGARSIGPRGRRGNGVFKGKPMLLGFRAQSGTYFFSHVTSADRFHLCFFSALMFASLVQFKIYEVKLRFLGNGIISEEDYVIGVYLIQRDQKLELVHCVRKEAFSFTN